MKRCNIVAESSCGVPYNTAIDTDNGKFVKFEDVKVMMEAVAFCLHCIDKAELTVAEKHIADILVENGFGKWDKKIYKGDNIVEVIFQCVK